MAATQLGVLFTATTRTLKRFPIYQPDKGEVLIKNVCVAANPKDYKFPTRVEGYSAIEGNDVAGEIAAVGEGETEFKVGDRVASMSKAGTQDNKYGAYAEYTVSHAKTTFHIGPNTSFESAATVPLAGITAVIGLFKILSLPEPPATGFAPSSGKGILIYGVSTSVGSYAVQLAKRAGFFVVGVCGSSKEYASTLGADVLISYKDEKDLEGALVSAAKVPISHAYDCITLHQSANLLANVLAKVSPTKTGKVAFVGMPPKEELEKFPAGIEAERVWATTAHGADGDFAAKYYRWIGKWLEDGSFKANRVRLMPDGLASVDQGIKMLQNGEVHAEKLVYRIADTPELKA